MRLNLMGLEVHLGIENHELLLQALSVWTHEVVLAEMLLERVVVDIVLLLAAAFSAVTDVTSFVLVSAMCV